MRLEDIIADHRVSVGRARVQSPPVNDNLTFADRVKAEIAAAASAVGEVYAERELIGFAADASEVANSIRRRL